MKPLKKITALLFCLILIVTQVTAVAEADNVQVFYSTFSITLHYNHFFSQYGVTVYLDDVPVDHLDQGDVATFGAYMADDRMHELRFVADDSTIPDRTWSIGNLQHGSALTCEIQVKHNQVKIKSYDLSVDGENVVSVSPDTAETVKIIGTVIVWAAKAYQAMQ